MAQSGFERIGTDLASFCGLVRAVFTPDKPLSEANLASLDAEIATKCQELELKLPEVKELLGYLLHYKKHQPQAAVIIAYSQKAADSGQTSEVLRTLLGICGIPTGYLEPHRDTEDFKLRPEELEALKQQGFSVKEAASGEQRIGYQGKPVAVFVTGHHEPLGTKVEGRYRHRGLSRRRERPPEIIWPVTKVAEYIGKTFEQVAVIQLCICYGQYSVEAFTSLCPQVFGVKNPFRRLTHYLSLSKLNEFIREDLAILGGKDALAQASKVKVADSPAEAKEPVETLKSTELEPKPLAAVASPKETKESVQPPMSLAPVLTKPSKSRASAWSPGKLALCLFLTLLGLTALSLGLAALVAASALSGLGLAGAVALLAVGSLLLVATAALSLPAKPARKEATPLLGQQQNQNLSVHPQPSTRPGRGNRAAFVKPVMVNGARFWKRPSKPDATVEREPVVPVAAVRP